MPNSITIAFANQKGGVGKTTSAVNMAAALGALGHPTLLVDLDPQGNATSGVGVNKKKVKCSVYEAISDLCEPKEAVIQTAFKNLSVMPSSMNLAAADLELAESKKRQSAVRLILDELLALKKRVIAARIRTKGLTREIEAIDKGVLTPPTL